MEQLLQQNDLRYIEGAPKVNLLDILLSNQIHNFLHGRLLMTFCEIYVGMCLAYDKAEY